VSGNYCLRAAHRRFVASIIAFRPAALSFRFLRTGEDVVSDVDTIARFAANLFRCAAAILARAAADIRRRFVMDAEEAAPSFAGPPLNICRSSAICTLIRFFCSSKPSIAAVISSRLSFAGIELTIIVQPHWWMKPLGFIAKFGKREREGPAELRSGAGS
jgi:hypothetical protein